MSASDPHTEPYRIRSWGAPYFDIGEQGDLVVRPCAEGASVPVPEIIDALGKAGVEPPVTLRFPQIIAHRVRIINEAFQRALRETGCNARYRGVFPLKVNQRRDVVQVLARAGRKYAYGLEVGSKAELVAALTMDPNRRSLLIVNGFKDHDFLAAACSATRLKDEVVIVIDELGELDRLVGLMGDAPPVLGLRVRMRSQAPGKWALSGGENAKFGLSPAQLLQAVERLRDAGRLDRLQMLHFHMGSQVSDIRRLSEAVREAARIHVELVRLGVPLRLLDVGGGLAVDYDGSSSSNHNSRNYTEQEYANTIVNGIKEVCDAAGMPVPDIISESGRAVVSHHALLVLDVVHAQEQHGTTPGDPRPEDPKVLQSLYRSVEQVSPDNAVELFHDVLQQRDDLRALFDLGHLGLPSLARGEQLVHTLLARIRKHLQDAGQTDCEEYRFASRLLEKRLVCNFSLFQSLPDVWGVKQQFPIVPVQRLDEPPEEVATLADITCDSDGEVRRYIGDRTTHPTLPVHTIRPGQRYALAVALVGAYQDTLGDYHNLFGETDEASVEVQDGTWSIVRTDAGSRVQDMLAWVRYDASDLRRRLRRRILRLQDKGDVSEAEAAALIEQFGRLLGSPTYLEGAHKRNQRSLPDA